MSAASQERHPIITTDLEAILSTELPWSILDGKTILITGAYGFLPAYMVETLLYLNEQMAKPSIKIIALVRNEVKARKRFQFYARRPELHFLVQDVVKPVDYSGAIDYIIHAASKASPRYYATDSLDIIGANVFGTHNILQLAQRKHAQGALFFSTSEVYGEVDDSQSRMSEDHYGRLDPTQIRSCYAESKRLGETMCVVWARHHEVPVYIVRPFHTYGPGMDLEDGRVFVDFVADVVARRDISMRSDGRAQRAFCYSADATSGFFTVLLKGQVGQAYNVGNPEGEISIGELADFLINMFPERELRVIRQDTKISDYLPNPALRSCPDISKIKQLGWRPTTGLAEGFRRTVLSYDNPKVASVVSGQTD
jgi:nucleoside-diphosphate-sugar epimerase